MDTKRDILRGFIKVHILYHAAQEPVYGLGLIQELARHGYHLSPGTLYPLLHSMQQDGYLVSQEQIVGGKIRRYYRSTGLGEMPRPRLKNWCPKCWSPCRRMTLDSLDMRL